MFTEEWEVEWERVLWKKKPYPDNYVPRSFLSSLSRNRQCSPHLPPLAQSYLIMDSQLPAIYVLAPRHPFVPHKPAPREHIRVARRVREASTTIAGSTGPDMDICGGFSGRVPYVGALGVQSRKSRGTVYQSCVLISLLPRSIR